MALLSQGPLGTFSGTIGAITCASSKTGLTARARRSQNAGTSPTQNAEQLKFAGLTTVWHSAAMDNLRPAWNTYAANTPIVNRLGTPRLLSGYNTWLRFAPLIHAFLNGNIYLQPPGTHNISYMSGLSAYIDSIPTLIVVAPGVWNPALTYEQVQFARFQPTKGKVRRPIWNNIIGTLGLKTLTTEDYSTALPPSTVPVIGETWALRARWFPVTWNYTLDTYQIDCEPTPWAYCTTTASS